MSLLSEGKLKFHLKRSAGQITGVGVTSSRRPAAGVLCGRSLTEALVLVPRLFSLCGQAQGHAARRAMAAAAGDVGTWALPDALVREAIGEHLWRLLLDWPALAGRAPEALRLRDWRRRLQRNDDAAALADDLLMALDTLIPPPADLAVLAPFSCPERTPLLPCLSATDWARQPLGRDFALAPVWAGAPAETGVLARHAAQPEVAALLAEGHLLAARMAARRADLVVLARALADPAQLAGWCSAAQLAPGVGLARVETARGLLLHLIQVNDGRVGDYVIVAPTEWNFHPQGAFVRELTGLPAPTNEAAAAQAHRLALSLDPCVAFEVVVDDA